MTEDHPQRPESPYGITKMAAEHYLRYYARDHGLRFTALRYGNVYGPRQDSRGEAGVVAIFARQLLSGQTPTIHWDDEQVRDYVYVGDVARAKLRAACAGDGGCYCIGTGVGTSVNRLYELLCRSPLIDRPGAFAALGLVLTTAAAWALSHWLSGRATYMHVGAAVGTIMVANVFFVIIPAHWNMVRAIEAGREPDASRGKAAARRSLHNNYLTLPVVLVMISNHYPMTYRHPLGWLILGALG